VAKVTAHAGKTPAFILFITSLLVDYWVHYNLATGQIDTK
jgi:pyrroline-5-carboxylate reductase